MSCKKVRKYLFAFADGQLSVQSNCEVLDHLKMCQACSAIVDEHQSLRSAIRKSAQRIKIPQAFKQQIYKAARTGKWEKLRRRSHSTQFRHTHGKHLMGKRLFRMLTLAASLALVATVAWQFYSPKPSTDRDIIASDSTTLPVLPLELVKMVTDRHESCIYNCKANMHQNPALPRDRALVADAIRTHFLGKLTAIAPDLTGRGFVFDSANFCCIPKKKGCIAGHVMYANAKQGSWLSLFSMPHWAAIDPWSSRIAATRSDQVYYTASTRDNPSSSILVWNQGGATYICCGRLGVQEMKDLAGDLRLALSRPKAREMLAAIFSLK